MQTSKLTVLDICFPAVGIDVGLLSRLTLQLQNLHVISPNSGKPNLPAVIPP